MTEVEEEEKEKTEGCGRDLSSVSISLTLSGCFSQPAPSRNVFFFITKLRMGCVGGWVGDVVVRACGLDKIIIRII